MLQIDFKFDTFEEAMDVLGEMFKIMKKNKVVSYADLYSLVNKKEPISSEYYKFGWTNLFYSKVEPYGKNMWVIRMPELVSIEKKLEI